MAEEKILEFVEAIRKRPAMYIGSTSNRGFVEMFRSSIIHTLNRFVEADYLIELLGEMKAKIEITNVNQKISDSLVNDLWKEAPTRNDFVFVALNALSISFELNLYDEGGNLLLHQNYKEGEITKGERSNTEFNAQKIEIIFELDEKIFEIDYPMNENFLIGELQKFAFLNKGRSLGIEYQVNDKKYKALFCSENGLQDLIGVEKLKGILGTYFDTHFEKHFDDFFVEVAFAFRETPVDETVLKSFVNNELTHENGTHIDGLLKGITYGVMKHFQKHALTQKYKISEKGILDELVAAIHVKMSKPQFSGCVKNKLASPEIIEPISVYVSELLFHKIENDEESKEKLIRKFRVYE